MQKSLSQLVLSFLLAASLFVGLVPRGAVAQMAPAVGTRTDSTYSAKLQTIEEKLDAKRKEYGIPGVSLVIVKDDQIIYMKGLGYKDFEKQVPVTPDTQFAIGSATKAFTALTVLMAQDEGKLSIDDSPKKYLPYFHMYAPDTDKNITIRDLMSHSSGLNRTDLAMITGKLSRAELIEVAGQAKPTAKLHEKFQYQNIMFVAAGETAATAEKSTWDKLVASRIFAPLGMTNSTLSISQLEKAKDRSFGYNYNFDTKETTRLPYREITQVAPAGSINSSARDMAQWLRFVLNGGTVNGKRLISENSYNEWLKPQMKISPDGKFSYGFGWFLQDWHGLKVVQHGGNIDGFNSMVAMIPEKKLGFVLLTNVSASNLGNDAMDIVWSNILGDDADIPKTGGPSNTTAPATTEIKDSGAAKELVGQYMIPNTPVSVEIQEVGGAVTFNIEGQPPYTLKETGKDTFSMSPLPADQFSLKAKRDESGKVISVIVSQPGAQPEFVRKSASAADTPTISVDELMQKTIEAAGGEANLRKITSRIVEADIDMENQGVKASTVSYTKAPNKAATQTTFTALNKTIGTGWDFFDGTAGEEAYSFAPADKYSGKRLEDARIGADFYSPLDWKTNFKKIEVKGTAKVNGEDAWIVSFEPEKGTSFKEYYSAKTFLLLKREGVIPVSTSSVQLPYAVTYSDYRSVDGVMLPFHTVTNSIANGNVVTTIKSLKQNVPVDDAIFAPRKLQ
ncbi:MAG TPA: serine hydrolase [Pyrinomonadaceae bacterium]|nr:serine hydrolase [Pyrinomonadaceae bacterium]